MPLNAAQRRGLRARVHGLSVRLQVGGNGLSPALLREADAVLERDELVKVRLPAGREARDALLAGLAEGCNAEVISAIGRTGVLFRAAGRASVQASRSRDTAASADAIVESPTSSATASAIVEVSSGALTGDGESENPAT
jgi:RNA-binding protein